jgi:hypothetical protein
VILRPVLALVTTAAAVPSLGLLHAEPTIAPTGQVVPGRVEPTGVLDVPPHCRLLPPDQQPERRPAGAAASGDGMVVMVYVPATTCNTPY